MSASAATYTPPVDQPPPPADATPYGGFWVRLAAYVVDGFIIGLGTMLVAVIWALALGGRSADAAANVLTLILIILGQFYHAFFISSTKMATPGKRLCGLFVTDLEGHRLSFGRALWRNIAALFSYLTLYIGFFMAGFTERKQALHDKMAGTLVHRQSRSSATIVIVIVVVLLVGVAVLGILAAIAIPAYQDYTVRAKMSGVVVAMSGTKAPIGEYATLKGAWPTTWEQVEAVGGANPMRQVPEASRSLVEDIRLEQGGVVVAAVHFQHRQGEIRLTPLKAGTAIEWTCTSSPEIRKFVPVACRK